MLPRNIVPVYKPRVRGAANACPAGTPNLVYRGGPVIQNVKVYSVLWTANVDPNVVANIGQFYTDVTSSSYLDWLNEYNTLGVTPVDMGSSTNQGISRGSYGGSFTITPTTTPCTGATPCTLDDTSIKAELAAQIAAGHLPQPTVGCDGQVSSLYMFEFPASVTITFTEAGMQFTSCSVFCGYHMSATINGQVVPYGVHPDMETGLCASNCSSVGAANFNDVTSVHSHELVEAITDAEPTIDNTGYIRPSAWGDDNCGEIGDACNFLEQPVTLNGHTWTVQQLWSNRLGNCVVAGSPPPVCTGPNTPPGCRACTCADNNYGGPAANGCDGSLPYCETNGTNVKSGDCVQCTQNSQCAANTFCEQSSTPSQDDICAPCGGIGQLCCPTATPCAAGAVCQAGTCVACGGAGQACCTGNVCTAPNTCGGGGTMGVCGCTPIAACPAPDNCGTLPDGCGGVVNCGSCTSPSTCGGGGTMNVCGCTPLTACPVPDNCGTISDNCGGMVNCGSCSSPNTCGGGGTANVCGCMPITTCPAPANCGSIANGCGGMVNCGSCGAGQTCSSTNQCVSSVPDGGTGEGGPPGDSGTPGDSGSRTDSGSGGRDGSTSNDSGSSGSDSSSGGSDGASAEGGGGGGGGSSGCGCRVAGTERSSSLALFGFGALFVVGVRRRRRDYGCHSKAPMSNARP